MIRPHLKRTQTRNEKPPEVKKKTEGVWQTYTYNGPLTPELEQAFKKEASRALSRSSGTPLGFSVSTSVTTVNGVTRGSTEFQVGKGTAWTSEERRNLDEKFGRLAPDGRMIGPDGRPLYPPNGPQIKELEDTPHQPRTILPPPSAAHTHTAHNAHQPQAAVPPHAHAPNAHTVGSSAGGTVHQQDFAYAYPSPVSPKGAGYQDARTGPQSVVSTTSGKKSSRHKTSDGQQPGSVASGHGHQERRGLAAADAAGRGHVQPSSHGQGHASTQGSSRVSQTDPHHHSPAPHSTAPALAPINTNPVHPLHPNHHHSNQDHAHFTPTTLDKKHGHLGGISSYPAQPTVVGVGVGGTEKPLPPPPEAHTRSRSEGGGGSLRGWSSSFRAKREGRTKREGAV
ncbi:hypothetical protein L202_00753 [Cryptococcus amylolentus CBS 6039]|uniref:Uncharacterized protein n=1 Tax=Cryptococcus amylolentus CBS 6039 TaxID=1295533 RepID=A0A1E3IAW6_9TREE|nr:hypothetical protein L202_00753 [Cryptococcus amylolentus CBS 6039]ODN84901.1 hypothetical protein L202_00753 [Cryptococcus amylolentus CBS 6039]